MKKIYYVFFFFVFVIRIFPQTGTISSQYGAGWFIEGVSPLINTFQVTGYPVNTSKVIFYAIDTSNYIIDSIIDNTSSDGFKANFDMGLMEFGTIINCDYYDNSASLLDYSADYELNIIPLPEWLYDYNSKADSIIISNGKILMKCIYPIYEYNEYIPSNVYAIGDLSFNLIGEIVSNVEFNMSSRTSSTSGNYAKILLNTFDLDIPVASLQIPDNYISYDSSFNIFLYYTDTIFIPKEPITVSFSFPKLIITAGLDLKFDGDISMQGSLYGQLVLGKDITTNNFGFIEKDSKQTEIVASLNGKGNIRATFIVLGGCAKARGSLFIDALVKGGLGFVQYPSIQYDTIFGGYVKVDGTVNLGFGIFNKTWGPENLLYEPFGDDLKSSELGSYQVVKKNGLTTIPDKNPSPAFATRDANLYSVWIEDDNENNYLLLSMLSEDKSSFKKEIIVEKTNNAISNPKISLFKSGSALITYTKNRYNSTTLPANITEEELIAAQDIWVAIYDTIGDTIIFNQAIADNASDITNSRTEGQASCAMNNATEGLITWIVKDNTNSNTIYFSIIEESETDFSITEPEELSALINGYNHHVCVNYINETEAIALWINDPDGDLNTNDQRIMESFWDGSDWSNPSVFQDNNGNESITELESAFGDDYLSIAFTSSEKRKNAFYNYIEIYTYDFVDEKWLDSLDYSDFDSTYYFQKPRLAISDDGILAVSYQAVKTTYDSATVDPGILYLLIRDLYMPDEDYEEILNDYLYDDNAFIWDISIGFDDENNFYSLSQEYTKDGIVQSPSNGILFGNKDLSMVLRGVNIDTNTLAISDIAEPVTPAGITEKTSYNPSLISVYPNPITDYAIIDVHVKERSNVVIDVFGMKGEKVSTLINQSFNPGFYQITFKPDNLQNGLYLLKLTVDDVVYVRKILVQR